MAPKVRLARSGSSPGQYQPLYSLYSLERSWQRRQNARFISLVGLSPNRSMLKGDQCPCRLRAQAILRPPSFLFRRHRALVRAAVPCSPTAMCPWGLGSPGISSLFSLRLRNRPKARCLVGQLVGRATVTEPASLFGPALPQMTTLPILHGVSALTVSSLPCIQFDRVPPTTC